MRGAGKRQASAFRHVVLGSWYAAAFARVKKLPKLESILRKLAPKGPKRKQTGEELEAVARQWVKRLGGTFKKRP